MLKRSGQFALCLLLLACAGISAGAQLKADFSVDVQAGCSPLQVHFQNTSTGTGGSTLYEWDFGNGNGSTLASSAAIFTEEKQYTVTLSIRNGNEVSSKSVSIRVYPRPSVTFSTALPRGCLPFNADFKAAANSSAGSISRYYWDFGDGSTASSTQPAIQHLYSDTGTYPAILTVTNEYGCSNSWRKDSVITALPEITAQFSASKTILCHPMESVTFSNTSRGPGTLSYTWDFGDGQSSTATNPQHVYTQKGVYDVTLQVRSSEGCSISKTQTALLAVGTFQSSFTAPAVPCLNNDITFNSTSTPYPDQSQWLVNGNPYYSYGSQFIYRFPAAGNYTVSLVNQFGTCLDTVSRSITINPSPEAGFRIGPINACGAPATVQFEDTTSGVVSRSWKFDWPAVNSADTQAIAQYTYTQNRFYLVNLQVTDAKGCVGSVTQPLHIASPEVNIYYLSTSSNLGVVGCGPFSIQWAANSSDSIAAYNWDFGDGGRSTEAKPTYLFQKEGTFQVSLNYTTAAGCQGTVYFNGITVYGMPKADFTSASGIVICGNTPVQFTDLSSGPFAYEVWDYGDGLPNYNGPTGVHQYQAEGTYTVRLIVSNYACRDTATRINYIQVKPPFPKIRTVTNTCDADRDRVTFTQASVGASSLTWKFGDGTQLTDSGLANQQQHTYPATGSYLLRLEASAGSCVVSDSTQVLVLKKQYPVVTGDKIQLCSGQQLNYWVSGLAGNPGFNTNLYTPYWPTEVWYSDGTPFTGTHVVGDAYTPNIRGWLTNLQPGKDSLRLLIKSAYFGCVDTSNYIPIKVKDVAAGFEILSDSNCLGTPVRLRDTSTAAGNTRLSSWTWDFGDGQVLTRQQGGTVDHLYAQPGYYAVSLRVTDNSGCSNVPVYASRSVLVRGPVAAFNASATSIPALGSVSFYNTSNLNASGTVNWTWDFGDGLSASGYNATHSFNTAGTYTVVLTAVDPASGCRSEARQTIVVQPLVPAFGFSKTSLTSTGCPPWLYQFSNQASNAYRLEWDFGDGFTAGNVSNPSHVYEKPGRYVVRQTVYDSNGNQKSYSDTVTIAVPMAMGSLLNAEGCIGQQVSLISGSAAAATFTWDFGDGNLGAASGDTVRHSYQSAGSFRPVLLMRDAAGCLVAAPADSVVRIHPNPLLAIAPAAARLCRGAAITLQASGAAQYAWSPGQGLSSTALPTVMASPDSSRLYRVSGTDMFGCQGRDSVWVQVVQPPRLLAGADTALCQGERFFLQASGAEQYRWIGFTGGLADVSAATQWVTATDNGIYTVVGSDAAGCFTDTARVRVQVYPLPTVNAGADQEAVAGSPVALTSTGSGDVVGWSWQPDRYLNCSDCASPVSTPEGDIIYTLTVRNAQGCTASDDVIITVKCSALLVRVPNAFTPNGDGHNDVFMVKGINRIRHLVIYNRWGQQVFEKSNFLAADRSACWDGTLHGFPAEAGTYVYLIEMECPDGGSFSRKGTVTLIR